MILVTGGAGFIGSNFVLNWIAQHQEPVLNVDALTYAGNLKNLESVRDSPRYLFAHADVADRTLIGKLLAKHPPRAIIHFAAESHVDRSILGPDAFVQTNVIGTFHLLDETTRYWRALPEARKREFRFLHVSTDEVYGSLGPGDPAFRETTSYAPNSPYAASKAASDHMVRAYHHTYGLPTLTTHCSNNYGPYQFPEKLIPLMTHNALNGKPLPVYGDGRQVRDWLHVSDHCAALERVLESGQVGQTYNIGGRHEVENIAVVKTLCGLLDEMSPRLNRDPYASLITYVTDRPGHDRRYAIDCGKIERELQWTPTESFESGLRMTLRWYLDNAQWVRSVVSGEYRAWVERNDPSLVSVS